MLWLFFQVDKFVHCTSSKSNASHFIMLAQQADGGGMAVEVEPSHQYSVTFCCCMTEGCRGALWQNSVWYGSACEV